MSRRAFAGLALALVVLAAIPEFASRTLPDTAWLLYAADRWLGGSRLYVDLVEVNPPLIVWLNAVPVLIGRGLEISPLLVYRLLVVLLALASVWECDRLLRTLLGPEALWPHRALTLLLLFVVLPLARRDFGEREHLMLMLALPYILLAAARVQGARLSTGTALAAGFAAGVGIGLKPYFVLLWLALEAFVRLWQRRWRARIESLTVVLVGLLYAGAVLRWAPDYFDVVRRMAGPYYGFLSNSLAVTALLGEGALLPLAAMAGYLALRRMAGHGPLRGALFWATLALYVSAVLQHKGWRYHFYPAMATGTALLGVLALDLRGIVASGLPRVYGLIVRVALGAVLVLTAMACVVQAVRPLDPRYDADPDIGRLIPVVRAQAHGETVLVLSWSMASTFPLLTYAGVAPASRFNHLWILAAAYRDQLAAAAPLRYREPAEMDALERYLLDAVVEDFARGRPGLLLVLRPAPDTPEWGLRRLDFLKYFERDPRFARLFARYRYREEIGQYWLFERLPDSAAP